MVDIPYIFWFIAAILLMWLIIAIFKSYLKFFKQLAAHKKALIHLEGVPDCKAELLECYVKFTGRIQAKQTIHSTLFNEKGYFIWSRVIANWETKKKKPDRGIEKHSKVLWTDYSAELLTLTHADLTIHIDLNDFMDHGKIELPQKERTEIHCPSVCQDKALAKYKQYQLNEIIIYQELITVYGKLIQKPKLGFMITSTGFVDYPSVIIAAKNKTFWESFKQSYKSKIQSLIIIRILLTVFWLAVFYCLITCLIDN